MATSPALRFREEMTIQPVFEVPLRSAVPFAHSSGKVLERLSTMVTDVPLGKRVSRRENDTGCWNSHSKGFWT